MDYFDSPARIRHWDWEVAFKVSHKASARLDKIWNFWKPEIADFAEVVKLVDATCLVVAEGEDGRDSKSEIPLHIKLQHSQ